MGKKITSKMNMITIQNIQTTVDYYEYDIIQKYFDFNDNYSSSNKKIMTNGLTNKYLMKLNEIN